MSIKISEEMAQQELNKWLDAKRVSDKKRQDLDSIVETLVPSFQSGILVFDPEKNELIQKLDYKLGSGEHEVSELRYKMRVTVKQVRQAMEGTKTSDLEARLVGYVSAYTSKPKALIDGMDYEDFKVSQMVASFFM